MLYAYIINILGEPLWFCGILSDAKIKVKLKDPGSAPYHGQGKLNMKYDLSVTTIFI
jgi:hypothetical protein